MGEDVWAGLTATVDALVVVIAVIANVTMTALFLARAWGRGELGPRIGVVLELLALPALGAAAVNLLAGREAWWVLLPLPFVLFCLEELLLDYLLKVDFRYKNTRLLGPYLLAYYLGLFGLIGYAFLAGKPYGYLVLALYFVNLAATWYAYGRVRHG